MNPIRDFLGDLLKASLVDVVKALFWPLLVALATFATSQSTLSYFNVKGSWFWFGVTFTTFISIYGTVVIYEKLMGVRPAFAPLDMSFLNREFVVALKYIDRDNLEYQKVKKLTALKDNLRSFTDKYSWTGDKDVSITCNDPNHAFREREHTTLYSSYEVDFRRSLKAGEEEVVDITWKLTDRNRSFVPFIAATIEQQTHKLELRLDAAAIVDKVGRVFVEITSHLAADHPYETVAIEGKEGVFVYKTDRPKLLHTYQMRWITIE